MAHPNYKERRETVGKVLAAGIQIGTREAKVLGVLFSCHPSAIQADVKAIKTEPEKAARLAQAVRMLLR